MAPTASQLKALRWFDERGRACMFGKGDPSLVMVRSLRNLGWLETDGAERGRLGFTYYKLSDLGKQILAGAS